MWPLLIFLLLLVLIGFPIWVFIRIVALGRENEAIAQKLARLETDLLTQRPAPPAAPAVFPLASTPAFLAPITPVEPPPVSAAPAALDILPAPVQSAPAATFAAAEPPPLLRTEIPPEPEPAEEPPVPRINWEQFMGAKLFAWLGGLAAFLGAAFFVKYSFEHDLIPPEVRVALGFLFALGLVIGGLKMDRARYAVTVQTLCATGIVVLYAVTFACNGVYHFAFFGPIATLLLMALITATAFLLAVRLDARVVAVLGILGGFLTPVLLSTGQDNPAGLFGYLALLNAGLIAVALHRRWNFLVPLGAAGTVVMEIGWAEKFLLPNPTEKAGIAVGIILGFCALFLGAFLAARRWNRAAAGITWTAIALPAVAFCYALALVGMPVLGPRPGLLFTLIFLVDACVLVLAWLDEERARLHLAAGIAAFALLAAWTGSRLTTELLPWALAGYLLHAALHTAFPLLLERRRPAAVPVGWSQLFPPLALLLMLGPLFRLEAVSLVYWPCVLLVDLLAMVLALATASLAGVAMVLTLTLLATALWILRVPATLAVSNDLLFVIGGFAVLFFAAGFFLVRRLGERLAPMTGAGAGLLGGPRGQLPAFSALLPFLLLIMMTQRLPLANPSPVFGLALLLVVLVLGLTAILLRSRAAADPAGTQAQDGLAWLPACALAGLSGLEYTWHARWSVSANAGVPLAWYLLFHAVFAIYPFVFRRRVAGETGPWAVAALSGATAFPLVYRLMQTAWPEHVSGLLPALFALPPLLSLALVLRGPDTGDRARLNQLAWFGGVALLFITLIFPIQFDRQWITISWALEGAALLWLFHRVPHPGLRATGTVLLVTAFARLALNPAVLAYHAHSSTPVLNWYFYSYGLVAACLFAGARLLAPPCEQVLGVRTPPLLNTLGTVLAFLLLNLEIADFFSSPGAPVLTFEFSGHFGRDMTYTIAWALFALGLLLVGIARRLPAGRYSALALLGVALLKLFFHDLARLEALYRVGALFAVAVIAIGASFAYQRFLPANEKSVPPPA